MKQILQLLVAIVLVTIVFAPTMAQGGINVKITWNKSVYATSYKLQVSTVTTFTTVVVDTVLADTTKTVNGLAPLTTYYWRVNATNSVGISPWSSVWSFTTGTVIPAAPTLVSPPNGATGVLASAKMMWQPTYGASSYRLQMATSPTFSHLTYNASGITSTFRSVKGLKARTQYYWRVYAVVKKKVTEWSAAYTFKTA